MKPKSIKWFYSVWTALAVVLLTGAAPARATEVLTFIHTDVAGSPVAATDINGNVIWREGYRPYGARTKNESAAAGNRQFFHGKTFDADTGLSYFGARYYDPTVGRFMGVDAVGFDEDNLHSFNRYAYGNNNPYKFLDPDGRNPVTIFGWLFTRLVQVVHAQRTMSAVEIAAGATGATAGTVGVANNAGRIANKAVSGFSSVESGIIQEARGMLRSAEMAQLRAAHEAGQSISVNIGGRLVQYEPGLPASGMTMFGENGFVIGREAFMTGDELGRTVLHELHRLSTSRSAGGVSGALAAQETAAAASFAERAIGAVSP